MTKKCFCLLMILCLMTAQTLAPAETVNLDGLMAEIDKEAKALEVGPLSFAISPDRQSIYLNRPEVTGAADYTIAYNIYDADSNPVNYFYSLEDRVAATPGYGGLFNVFVAVTDTATGEQNVQNIGWQELSWPIGEALIVGRAPYTLSADRRSIFIDRPDIRCRSGKVTIAYNIYDAQGNPVNYFYSTEKHVAATPGYTGRFNVFVVVTDTVTGESHTQNIGWVDRIGDGVGPTAEPTATPTPTAEPTATPDKWPIVVDHVVYDRYDHMHIIGDYESFWPQNVADCLSDDSIGVAGCEWDYTGDINIQSYVQGEPVLFIAYGAFEECPLTGTVSIPDTVIAIDYGAFYRAEFSYLQMGTGIKYISDSAFRYCGNMEGTIMLPDDCELYGGEPCFTMSKLNVTKGGRKWFTTRNGIYYRYDGNKLWVDGVRNDTENARIASSVNGIPVTGITDFAFNGTTNLRFLYVPNSIDHISDCCIENDNVDGMVLTVSLPWHFEGQDLSDAIIFDFDNIQILYHE